MNSDSMNALITEELKRIPRSESGSAQNHLRMVYNI